VNSHAFNTPANDLCSFPGCPERARTIELERRAAAPGDPRCAAVLCDPHRMAQVNAQEAAGGPPERPAVQACHLCAQAATQTCAFCHAHLCALHAFKPMSKLKVLVCRDCMATYQPKARWLIPKDFK